MKNKKIKKSNPWHFGPYGGRYVPETLMKALNELEAAYKKRDIGTKTYEQAKRTLIDSLARLYRSVDSQN